MINPAKKKKLIEKLQEDADYEKLSPYEKFRQGVINFFERGRKNVLAKAASGEKQSGYTDEHLKRMKNRQQDIDQIKSVREQLRIMDENSRKRMNK